MPYCSNCSYKLVLLPHRLKYKCAKCSHLFSQKQTEAKSFRNWNVKQRELDRHNLRFETLKRRKRKPALSREERLLKERLKRRKSIRRYLAREQAYYEKYNVRINERRRVKYQERREIQNQQRRLRRVVTLADKQLQGRIYFWKQKQKALADEYAENEFPEAYGDELSPSVPTFVLCELLMVGFAQ